MVVDLQVVNPLVVLPVKLRRPIATTHKISPSKVERQERVRLSRRQPITWFDGASLIQPDVNAAKLPNHLTTYLDIAQLAHGAQNKTCETPQTLP